MATVKYFQVGCRLKHCLQVGQSCTGCNPSSHPRTPPEFLELLVDLAQQLVQLLQGPVKVCLKCLCRQGPQFPDLGLQVCLSLLQSVPPYLNGLQLPLLVLQGGRAAWILGVQ